MSEFLGKSRKRLGRIKHGILRDRPEEPIVPTFTAHLNSPSSDWQVDKKVTIAGWLLPDEPFTVISIRARNNNKIISLKYGLKRHDVLKAYPDIDPKKALYTGFKKEFIYDEGTLDIEVDLGYGWQTIRSFNLKYSPEQLVDMIYDPEYAINSAEHANLQENKKKYYYEKPIEHSYEPHKDDTKLISFYLPQFHPIKENDKAWGKGFTEWTNVVGASPRFIGHNQPLLPTDLGYYDLRLADTIKEQIDLAKKHGIHGFCFYYYWFSGDRLLEKPLDIFLSHKEWDFNFMIAWANENWTKRWDGMDNDVIIAQKYLKDDPLNFIKDIEPILLDERYIRIDGRPVLVVYRGTKLNDPKRYVDAWRKYFLDKHSIELHILFVLGLDVIDPRPFGFDAGIEFEPLTIAKRTDFSSQKPLPINVFTRLLDRNFTGGVADYRQVALNPKRNVFDFPTYRSVMPSWDNDARKKGKGPTVFYGANPDIYAQWLDKTLYERSDDQLVFINAWNEWAEGAVLEPNVFTGNAYLNRTTQVLAKHSKNNDNATKFPLYGVKQSVKKLAVHVHVFYEEEWLFIAKRIKALKSIDYDLYITVTDRSNELRRIILADFPDAQIFHVPNRGRDILPFLHLLPRLKEAGYEYVLKMHTKRSLHRQDGKEWLSDLVKKLIPKEKVLNQIIEQLNKGVSLIGPSDHMVSMEEYIGSNYDQISLQLKNRFNEKHVNDYIQSISEEGYFAGSMYWARIDLFEPFINMPFIVEEFESERGQIDGTLAHAIERMVTALAVIQKKEIRKTNGLTISEIENEDINRDYKYVK